MSKSFRVNIAFNCIAQGTEDLPSAEFLERPDVFYDSRNNLLSYNCDFSNNEWYYNYLNTNALYAHKNPSAYPTYLLDLGFIPVVFLPSCCAHLSATMINTLVQKGIPHIKTGAYSFMLRRPVTDVLDAWVSKLDIERIFGIPLKDITSADVARRIFDGKQLIQSHD